MIRANYWLNITGLVVCFLGVYLLLVSGALWQGVARLIKKESWLDRILFERRIPEASFWGVLCLLIGFLLQLLALSM